MSPTWTLFIALKKALPYHWSCKANAQRHHLCKPYYSHLWTEGAARDAGRGWWKWDRLWNANCLLCASSEQKDPQSMFHAKQMIPFHKDNPDIPKWFFFFPFEMRRGCLLQSVRILKMHDRDDCKVELVQWILRSKPKSKSAEKDNHTHKKWHFMCTESPLVAAKYTNQGYWKKYIWNIENQTM